MIYLCNLEKPDEHFVKWAEENPCDQLLLTCCIITCHHCHYSDSNTLQRGEKRRGECHVIKRKESTSFATSGRAACRSGRCSTCNLGAMAARWARYYN